MPLRVGINGLGRIGRAFLRVAAERPQLAVVAANDLAPAHQLAPLLGRDSVHGRFCRSVATAPGGLAIASRQVRLWQQPDRASVPWREAAVELVIEATGCCERREQAAAHLRDSVRHVVVSANLPDADLTACLGVNDQALDPARQQVISNASCTTNCMAPVALVLDRAFGLRHGLLTTVHSYTRGQELLDSPHPDPRRARAAARNMVPTTTGAAAAVGLVLPHLAGRLEAQAVRVPVPNVSMVQFVVALERRPTLEQLAVALRDAAGRELAGILGVTDEEGVSSDFVGDPRSAVVDLPLLQQVGRGLYRVVAWYDNEWGYAHRLADLAQRLREERHDRAADAG
jgi:glyceraldehyde 3-phosphate dehydrogenase